MAPITIRDEDDLPAPSVNDIPRKFGYVRSMCDPHFMIAGGTGAVYVRKDGEPWEQPGMWVEVDLGTGKVTREPASAWFDSRIIRGKREKIA